MSDPTKSARERLAELRAKPLSRVGPPKPKSEVVAGPWPRPKLSDEELIRRQQELDRWWQQRLDETKRQSSPDQKLSNWIWRE
jgi:hypothetical protein